MHDAGGQLADRRQLLALEDLALDPVPLGHVLADGDDVGDLVPVEAHGNLAEPEEPRLPAQRDLLLRLLDLAGLEDPVELGAQLRRRLAGEHLEDRPADHVVAPEALGAGLPLPVPALDAVVAIDDVEAERQAVDDEAGEAAVLLDLAGLRRHLAGQVGRELDRGEIRRQEIRDDGQHLGIERVARRAGPRAAPAGRLRARAGSGASRAAPAARRASGPARAGPAPAAPAPARKAVDPGSRCHTVTASTGTPASEGLGHGGERGLGAEPLVEELGDRPRAAPAQRDSRAAPRGDAVAARLRIRQSPSIRRSTRCSIHSPSTTEPATGSSRRVVSHTAARSPSCR